jgi:hypothetical protein
MKKNRAIALIAVSAGAAVGLLLSARRRPRPSWFNVLTPDPNDDREAELIQLYAPALHEIASKDGVIGIQQ